MSQIIQPKEIDQILDKNQIEKFKELQKIISKINKTTNLTRLVEGDEYWISQVYDSVWPFIKKSGHRFDGKKFIDIGSGCGFPGLAYAITHPNSEVYLVDSSRKKIEALRKIVDVLNIRNKIHLIHERIENLAHKSLYRNNFDIGTIRAVSSPSTVAEYLLPILKIDGKGLIYCGKWTIKDSKKIQHSLKLLKGTIDEIKTTYLPKNKGERNVIFLKPQEDCPRLYPRAVGKPAKYPL